jgi:hypothetical protein
MSNERQPILHRPDTAKSSNFQLQVMLLAYLKECLQQLQDLYTCKQHWLVI